ncbi:hypothetical protein QYF36_012035 [Acer negundo]|nr:hypothetical protein QYF36_012035 [Acer negundo]
MNVELLNRILRVIETNDDYFTQKIDAIRKLGLSPLQKMMAVVWIPIYSCLADFLDEYVQIGKSIAIESLKHFCDDVIRVFETQYLRKPKTNDIARLLKEGEDQGFPGMLGSLDCMHWHQKNCPMVWHGSHTNGFKKYLILEVLASQGLWI